MKKIIFCIIALCLVFSANYYFRDDISGGEKVVISQVLQDSGAPATDGGVSAPAAGELELFHLPEDTKGVVEPPEDTEEPEPSETAEASSVSDDGYEPILSDKKVKLYNSTGTAVIGDTGYEIYNYVPGAAEAYARTLNHAGKLLGDKYRIYTLVVPTAVGITLPDNKADRVNSSDQEEAIQKLYKKIKAPVQKIDLYDIMMQHRTEYIFFRTDHHWTGLGAYYAYQEYCRKTERTPHALEEYETDSFGKFIGTYYGDSNQNKNLRTDKVKVYYPLSYKQLSMKYQTESGKIVKGHVIEDASHYGISGKYLAFLGGDNAYTIINNPGTAGDSACIVVKESYGNAFVPYLADHYRRIYVVDYRYWTGKLSTLAKKKKVQDILFVNNISMTRNTYLIGKLSQITR